MIVFTVTVHAAAPSGASRRFVEERSFLTEGEAFEFSLDCLVKGQSAEVRRMSVPRSVVGLAA